MEWFPDVGYSEVIQNGVRENIDLTLKWRVRLSLVPPEKKNGNRIIGLICPFLPPRVFVKCPSVRKMDGRGGGDRT